MTDVSAYRGRVPDVVLPTVAGSRYTGSPRQMVDDYWRLRPRQTDRFVILRCARRGAPLGWSWERHIADMRDKSRWTANFSFREPPRPYQFSSGAGHCGICGGPIYHLGWHRPWGRHQEINTRANWHAACASAWGRWTHPGFRLPDGYEADHFIPLYQVYRVLGRTGRWPDILWYWTDRNIQILSTEAHRRKSAREAAERARYRISAPSIVPDLLAEEECR